MNTFVLFHTDRGGRTQFYTPRGSLPYTPSVYAAQGFPTREAAQLVANALNDYRTDADWYNVAPAARFVEEEVAA